jgi:hypothetical protein
MPCRNGGENSVRVRQNPRGLSRCVGAPESDGRRGCKRTRSRQNEQSPRVWHPWHGFGGHDSFEVGHVAHLFFPPPPPPPPPPVPIMPFALKFSEIKHYSIVGKVRGDNNRRAS